MQLLESCRPKRQFVIHSFYPLSVFRYFEQEERCSTKNISDPVVTYSPKLDLIPQNEICYIASCFRLG